MPEGRAGGSGLAQAIGEQFSFERAFGGTRGMIESALPFTVLSLVYGVTQDIVVSCVAAAVPAVLFAIWRLVRREPLTQALSGVLGVAIGAVLAVRTGHAENFFLPSIIKNLAYGVPFAVSALVRWPLVGVVLGFMLGEQTHWRQVPARYRVYRLATWVWAALFAVRLAVEIPLYLRHETTALGLAAVPLGLPLFALVLWLTWVLVHRVPVVRPPEHEDAEQGEPEQGEPDDEPVVRSGAPG